MGLGFCVESHPEEILIGCCFLMTPDIENACHDMSVTGRKKTSKI